VKYLYDGPTSYAFNMIAFVGPVRFPLGITDGTSNTIAFSERYFHTHDQGRRRPLNEPGSLSSYLMFGDVNPAYESATPGVLNNLGERRPSFADAGWGDVVPVTKGNVTRPSLSGLTFQVRPQLLDADMRIPQTPFRAGLPVALFDGSVRTVRPGVAEEVFWAAVTPRGGEVTSLE
jgi:hypothetical protein